MPQSTMDRSSRQKINEKIADLSNPTDQMDLTDLHKMFPPTSGYGSLSSTHGTFSRIDHASGHPKVLAHLKRLKSYQESNHKWYETRNQ